MQMVWYTKAGECTVNEKKKKEMEIRSQLIKIQSFAKFTLKKLQLNSTNCSLLSWQQRGLNSGVTLYPCSVWKWKCMNHQILQIFCQENSLCISTVLFSKISWCTRRSSFRCDGGFTQWIRKTYSYCPKAMNHTRQKRAWLLWQQEQTLLIRTLH